jgi:hypothetical protein
MPNAFDDALACDEVRSFLSNAIDQLALSARA